MSRWEHESGWDGGAVSKFRMKNGVTIVLDVYGPIGAMIYPRRDMSEAEFQEAVPRALVEVQQECRRRGVELVEVLVFRGFSTPSEKIWPTESAP